MIRPRPPISPTSALHEKFGIVNLRMQVGHRLKYSFFNSAPGTLEIYKNDKMTDMTDIMKEMRENPNVHLGHHLGNGRIEGDGLLYFMIHGYTGCGDAEVGDFLRFASIGADTILRELKAKAIHVEIHVGQSFNNIVTEAFQWAVLDIYDPAICECETIEGAGNNYVSAFHVKRQDIVDRWNNEWLDFKQVAHLPRIAFYQGSDGYVLDRKELVFVQKGKTAQLIEFKAIGYVFKGHLLAKRVKENKMTIKHVMQAAEGFDVPMLEVDKNLQGILGAISGSASSALSLLDVFFYLAGEKLVEKVEDRRCMKHFPGYHENLRAESYSCAKGTITMVTYRSDIDDYDVQLFLDGEPIHHAEHQQFEYDHLLGLIKKEE